MSDIKCARMLVRAAERDIAALRFLRDGREYTPYAVEFRYEGVGPDYETSDREDALSLVETLWEQVGTKMEEAEGG